MNSPLRILLLFLAVILIPKSVRCDAKVLPNTAVQSEIVFKLVKTLKLVGSEKLDFTVTFQDGQRIKTAVDESKPFCQVFFNSDTVLANHGRVGPLSMTPAATTPEGIRVLPGVAKTGGFVSVEISSSKGQAFPDKNSFSVSCSLFSEDATKASLFTFDQISKILGPSFTVIGASEANRDIAQDHK